MLAQINKEDLDKEKQNQYRIKVNFLYFRMFLPLSLGYAMLHIITVIKRGVYKNLKNQTSLSLRCSIYHNPAGGFIPKVLGCAAVEASCSPCSQDLLLDLSAASGVITYLKVSCISLLRSLFIKEL